MAFAAEKLDSNVSDNAPTSATRPLIYAVTPKKLDDDAMLGQFIPIHYHYQMLDQEPRIGGFEQAIMHAVKPGMRVVELGGGTGVLSFFAARAGAAKVYCVERIPHVARAAQRFAIQNGCADTVEVVIADASEFLPPQPVDVVICEMLHTGMLREKQLETIASFKSRYAERFPDAPMPRFIPEAAVMAVQPVFTNYAFHGYEATVPMFVGAENAHRVSRMAMPGIYASFTYGDAFPTDFDVDLTMTIERTGTINSLRFITKNLLAIVGEEGRSIDWDMHDLVIPLARPLAVRLGDNIRLRFRYVAGCSLLALAESIDGND